MDVFPRFSVLCCPV